MIDYAAAQAIAGEDGATRIASYAGGRTRRTKWKQTVDEFDEPCVEVTFHDTVIARFYATHVEVFTGGFNTLSTFEALNATFGWSIAFYTRHFVPYYLGTRMSEGMGIGYDGTVIMTTATPTPERSRRA